MAKIGSWDFTKRSGKDACGRWRDLELKGAYWSVDGLRVTPGGWARVRGYNGGAIREKTLVVWLRLESVSTLRPAGAAMSIDATNRDQFDAIVLGERQDLTWMAGSSNFERTRDPGDPRARELKAGEVVQMAAIYSDAGNGQARVRLLRNGVQLADYVQGPLRTWNGNEAEILFGPRHTRGDNPVGGLDATILRAEIHDDANAASAGASAPHSLSYKDLIIGCTTSFELVWNDAGSGAKANGAYYRPLTPDGFWPVGHLAQRGYDAPSKAVMLVVKAGKPEPGTLPALAAPLDYEEVWRDKGSGARLDGAFWKPLPPSGYRALGFVATRGYNKPSPDAVRCVRADLVASGLPGPEIWADRGSGANRDFGSWAILAPPSASEDEACVAANTFFGAATHNQPGTSDVLYTLKVAIPPLEPQKSLTVPTEAQVRSGQEVVQSCSYRLPFFAVADDQLSDAQKLLQSPYYVVQRTDKFVIAEQYHNVSSLTQQFTWEATEGYSESEAREFSTTIGITRTIEAGASIEVVNLSSSLSLSLSFTAGITKTSSKETTTKRSFPVTIPAGRSVVLWQIESTFRVSRADGTRVGRVLTGRVPGRTALAEYGLLGSQ